MKLLVMVATAIIVPGGLLLLAIVWRRRWIAQERQAIDARIRPPRALYGETTPREMEQLRTSAQRRRDCADDKRREALRIESGHPVEEKLRLVR